MKNKSRPKYFAQISSMPYLGDLFKLEELPIHRKQMAALLRDIDQDDLVYMRAIEKFFVPRNDNFNISNQEYMERLENLLDKAPSRTLYNLIFEMHSIDLIAKALAARHTNITLDLLVSSPDKRVQALTDQIFHNHDRPYFAMQYQRPWVKNAYALLQADDYFGMQRLLLDVKWKLLAHFATYNYFNFEALVIYVLKWQFARIYLISNSKPNVQHIVLSTVMGVDDDSE